MKTCGHNCRILRGYLCEACKETPQTKPLPKVRTIAEQIPERAKIEQA